MTIRRFSALAPALTLFLLSPLIGEYLLGNLGIDMLGLMLVVAPLYGAGALLVREMARRWNAGWPGILLLGLAYGVVEEGLVTQSLFDPNYLGMRLLDYGYVPALGMGAWWTVFVLTLHVVWSIAAAIGLAEALWPGRAREPWVPGAALPVTGGVFVLGCFATEWAAGGAFDATPLQTAGALIVAGALVLAAWALGRRGAVPATERKSPSPLAAGCASFVLLSLFMLSTWSMTSIPPAWNVVWMLSALMALGFLVWRWSQRPGWGPAQQLGLIAGSLATYGWWSLLIPATVTQASPMVDTIGNLVFIAIAAGLVLLARRRIAAR